MFPLNAEQNYQTIAKNFFDKYSADSILGINWLVQYYDTKTMISLHFHLNGSNHLYELIGYKNFLEKTVELNIKSIRFVEVLHTVQPLDFDKVLFNVVGRAMMNDVCVGNITVTFILGIDIKGPKIIRQMLDFFA